VNAGDIFAQADALFESWKRGEDPFKKYPLVKHPPLPRTEVVVVEQPVETVSIQLGWHGPSTVGKSVKYTYAADLLSFALQDPASLFQKRLVDSGACVRAGLSWYTQQNTGPISLSLEAIPEKVDECVRTARAELPKMKMADYFSDDELKNAVHRLEVSQAQERETPSQLAHVLSFWWASAGLPYYLGYFDNVTRVTRQDIAAYLDDYVLDKHFVFGAVVSPEMVKNQHLDREHFEKLIGLRSAPTARSTASRQKALP
jgi:zinc protease